MIFDYASYSARKCKLFQSVIAAVLIVGGKSKPEKTRPPRKSPSPQKIRQGSAPQDVPEEEEEEENQIAAELMEVLQPEIEEQLPEGKETEEPHPEIDELPVQDENTPLDLSVTSAPPKKSQKSSAKPAAAEAGPLGLQPPSPRRSKRLLAQEKADRLLAEQLREQQINEAMRGNCIFPCFSTNVLLETSLSCFSMSVFFNRREHDGRASGRP